jgi:DNA-directed RNA polymerase specialized sigma24 family protein
MDDRSVQGTDDQELLARIAGGDPTALRLLMDRFDRLVRFTIYRTSRQRCRQDPIWIDSVASEVWTDLCRSLRAGRNRDIENIQSFFIQVTRRRCIDALRRPGIAPQAWQENGEGDESQAVSIKDDTLETISNLEQISALRECILALDEGDRGLCGEITAITAGRWTEAARRLGMPESTLRSRWARVLSKLRLCLEKKGKSVRA